MRLSFRAKKKIVKDFRSGVSASVLSKHFDVSKRHVYRLASQEFLVYEDIGRPKKEYPQELRDRIVELKRETSWGVHKLTFMLNKQQGLKLSHNAVHKILIERGEIKKEPKKSKRYKYIRFERQNPNSLWQTDWKWLSEEDCWLTAYLDDYSRFIVGASKFTEATTENTLKLLHKSAKKYVYPREILTDHGTQYWKKQGSKYQTELEKLGIKHIVGRIQHPQTTGKIERWWLTYIQESKPFNNLTKFIKYYNYKRPHQSLAYETPKTRYLNQ
ncbi:MAG: DDE-type integrase/transposase/recombinase [Candidatus Diapherotrites archaeon]